MFSETELKKIEKEIKDYEKETDVFDLVISFIIDSENGLNKKYEYRDNNNTFNIPNGFVDECGKTNIKSDLEFHLNSTTNDSMIFAEITEECSSKINQIKGYVYIDNESLRTLLGTNGTIYKDIFLIVPRENKDKAFVLYDELKKNDYFKNHIGKTFGFSIWLYKKDTIELLCGEFFSPNLKDMEKEKFTGLKSENKIGFYKSAPPIIILRQLILESLRDDEFGNNEYRITKTKLFGYFSQFNFKNEKRIKDSLELGEKIGILQNVDVNSCSCDLKYNKYHSSSLNQNICFLNDPIEFIKNQKKKNQTKLGQF